MLFCYMHIGTARVADSDYVAVSDTLMFPTNSVDGATQCVSITVTDDGVLEAEETFTLTLTVNTAGVLTGNDVTNITIIDDG